MALAECGILCMSAKVLRGCLVLFLLLNSGWLIHAASLDVRNLSTGL